MTLDSRIAALLEVVQAQRDGESRAWIEPARERARAMLAQARRSARARLHAVIAEERAQFASRVARAEAHLATRRRMVHQELARALLHDGHTQLAAALAQRWKSDASRQRWIEAALQRALATLPRTEWTIAGPRAWGETERRGAIERVLAGGVRAQCTADDGIEAGLRIAAGAIVLDATLAGLLDDRAAIEGRLLHLIRETTA